MDTNILFQWGFWIIVILCLLTFLAAAGWALKRGTFKSFYEVIRSMATDGVFLGALAAGLMALFMTNDVNAMVIAFSGFIGYKLVATEVVVVTNGAYRYSFFDDDGLNKWAGYTISTKTLMLLLGIGIAWYAGLHGLFKADDVSNQLIILASAWLGANGLPSITELAKGKDWSFLNPKPKEKTVLPVVPAGEVSAKPGEPGYVPASKESDNYVKPAPAVKTVYEFVPFDEASWNKDLEARSQSKFQSIDKWLQILSLPDLAGEKTVRFVKNLLAFGAWYMQKTEEAFVSKFGFKYEDRDNPESLAKLKDYCNKVPASFQTFIATTSNDQSFQTVYELVRDVKGKFAMVDWAMENDEKAYDAKLQEYTPYSYLLAFNQLSEFNV
jgi:hypothetical protein